MSHLPLSAQLFLALVGLAVAFYFGWQLRQTLFNNQENLARTLGATIVSTAYPHRGVTAFLVAELDKGLPSDSLKNENLNAAVGAIQSEIDQLRALVVENPKRFEPIVKATGSDAAKRNTAVKNPKGFDPISAASSGDATKPKTTIEDPNSFDPKAVFESLHLTVVDKPNFQMLECTLLPDHSATDATAPAISVINRECDGDDTPEPESYKGANAKIVAKD